MRRGDQGSALGISSVRELAPQAFRHCWVRGRIAKDGGKTYLFGCTVIGEVKGARGSDNTGDVACINSE